MNVDNSNEEPPTPQTSNADFPLPLLTEITDYEPNDYEDKGKVTQSVISLLTSFCNIENPDKSTVSSFVNIVTNTKQVKNKTAFKYVFDTFNEFNSYPEGKRNLKYLYSRVKGRIDDALVLVREQNAKTAKGIEKQESESVDNKDISQLANKMEFK